MLKIRKEIKYMVKQMTNNVESMLTTSDVSRILNVHINTVRRWSNQGVLKSYRIGSRGDRRFMRDDIDQFLAREKGLR